MWYWVRLKKTVEDEFSGEGRMYPVKAKIVCTITVLADDLPNVIKEANTKGYVLDEIRGTNCSGEPED